MDLSLQLPANMESESAVLGGILLDNSAFDQVSARLNAECFSLDSNRRIYLCMQELFEAGKPIEYASVEDQLEKRKELESVGGPNYIMRLTEGRMRGSNIVWHCDRILDKFISRQVIHASNSAIAAAYEQSDTGKRTLDYLLETLLTLQTNGCKQFAVRPVEISDQVMANMAEMREKKSRLIGFSLALDGINHKTTGLRKKELLVIGGRPGQGKTAFALQVAAENCRMGSGVGLFSLEMDKESIMQRLYCTTGNIEFTHIRVPFLLTDMDLYALDHAKTEVDSWPLFIDDDADGESGMNLQELCARIRLLKRQHGVRLFIVDFLQLVSTSGRDPREKVSKIVKRLRRLAKSEDIAVIALSQMPRPKTHAGNEKPTMHDFLESGEIEQAAHIAMIPWWPKDDTGLALDEKWMCILKQRNGETWDEAVKFIGKYQRYSSRVE